MIKMKIIAPALGISQGRVYYALRAISPLRGGSLFCPLTVTTSPLRVYIEPLALVRHGCGILLQAGIPCTCRACAAPRRAERSEESPVHCLRSKMTWVLCLPCVRGGLFLPPLNTCFKGGCPKDRGDDCTRGVSFVALRAPTSASPRAPLRVGQNDVIPCLFPSFRASIK